MNNKKFNGDLMRSKSLDDYVAFKAMYDLVYDKKAIATHIESLNYYAYDPSMHAEDTNIKLGSIKSEDIYSSLHHYGGLTVISLCTTFEIAAKDFLSCYFFQNPHSMYEFIGGHETKGMVQLKEMLAADSYQDLIVALSEQASSKASKGKYGEVLVRIAKLCKQEYDKNLATKLNDLQEIRNKIVHEKYSKHWLLEEISNFEGLVASVIEDLCKFGIKKSIPGNYSCVNTDYTMEIGSIAVLNN